MTEPPEINVPLDEWVEKIIDHALAKHEKRCPLAGRVRSLEIRFATLVGYMIGSGLVGGAAGAVVAKMLG